MTLICSRRTDHTCYNFSDYTVFTMETKLAAIGFYESANQSMDSSSGYLELNYHIASTRVMSKIVRIRVESIQFTCT